MYKLILLFCEGQDEPPYIYRILKMDGWRNWTDQTLKRYPTSIRGYLKAQLSNNAKLLDGDQWARRPSFTPQYILSKKEGEIDSFVLIFRLGGESKYADATECMKFFTIDEDSDFLGGYSLRIGFFYDQDTTIASRLKRFEDNMKGILPDFCDELGNFTSYFLHCQNKDNFNGLGLFIFHTADSEAVGGDLESHLLPLMRQDNEAIFDHAKNFFENHYKRDRAEKRPELMFKKSIIGITGQLQKSGKSNSVYISDCDYITDEKLRAFPPSQKLTEFMNELSK